MSGGNLSPRQKMINMMYLVLTALLALNVSAEILKAFHMVEVSMDRAGVNIDKKNEGTWKVIDKYHTNFGTDVNGTDIWNKAKKARQISGDAVKFFETLKETLITKAGGRKDLNPEEEVGKPDDIENHANYLINQGHGAEVKKKINDTRTQLIGLLPKDKQSGIKSDLITEEPKGSGGQTWESETFEHIPIAAVIAILSKTQNDIKNTEAQVLDELSKSLSGEDFTFDKLEPKVIPNNGTYITLGSEYSADIFVAASSSKSDASITVNNRPVPVEGGVGKYKVNPTSEGEVEYSGVITAKKPNGKVETYPFKSSFTALKPLAVISATKMNVVYIGLDNPISVSVPGYSPNDVSVSVSGGGSLRPDKQKGTYLFKIEGTGVREIVVTASVKDKEGKVKKMGEQRYRVRQVPKPIPMLGAIEMSGPVSQGALKTAAFVYAALKDFAFEGITFTPTEWTLVYQPRKGEPAVKKGYGPAVPADVRAILSSAKVGDRFTLVQVKANGPTGGVVIPSALALEVR